MKDFNSWKLVSPLWRLETRGQRKARQPRRVIEYAGVIETGRQGRSAAHYRLFDRRRRKLCEPQVQSVGSAW